MRPWTPPRCSPSSRLRFIGQFDPRRITRRDRGLLTDALRTGIVSPGDLERLGISPLTAADWMRLDRPAEIRPDPVRRAWLESRGLSNQALTTAELLAQESGLIVSHGAIMACLRSKARSKLVPVLMHRVRKALPDIKIANAHGIGFRWTGGAPWEGWSC